MMGYSPGEVYDRSGRMVSFEAHSKRRVELSVIKPLLDTSENIWSTLDEAAALKLLEQLVVACNYAFGKKLRIEGE